MKKLILFALAIVFSAAVLAQNLQLHYDMGKDRGYLTTTFEMFKPDKWGSTFIFVDYDYGVGQVEGVSNTYMEVSRALRFGEVPIEFKVEYNGGFGQFAPRMAFQINDAWLTGIQYTWNNESFTRVLTLQALYKYIRNQHNASFQFTGAWGLHFFNRKLTFSGFADFWREDKSFGPIKTSFVFLTEPQLWFNLTKNFSLGSEVEMGVNFGPNEGLKICPTVAAKWNF